MRNKGLIIGLIIGVVVVAAVFGIINALRSAVVVIQVAPTNATVTIGGKSYENGSYQFFPGKITAIISAEGFDSKTVDLQLDVNSQNKILTYLNPTNGDYSFYEKKENINSLNILLTANGFIGGVANEKQERFSTDQDDSADDFIKKIQIKNKMPIKFSQCGKPATRMNCNAIQIDYDYDEKCGNSLCLIIKSRSEKINDEIKEGVRKELMKVGYKLEDYKLSYSRKEF